MVVLLVCASVAQAAAPSITGVTTSQDTDSSAGSGSIVVTLPATIAAGDIIVLLLCPDSHAATAGVPSGFALLSTEALSRPVAMWKKAVGNEDGTTVVATLTGAGAVSANISFLVTGAVDPALEPPESSTKADDAGASVSPNPPSLNSSFDNRDIRWVAWACVDDDPLTSAYPSSYADNQTRFTYSTANQITNTFASRAETASDGTEDPGVFTMNASHFWSARTLAFSAAASNFIPILTPPRRTQ